jgi:hypothetical protein
LIAACAGFRILSILVIFFIHLIVAPVALSEIFVYDMVTISGREVMLHAETRGVLFSKGGELVEFFLDGSSLGRNLSGGDGVAYKRFVPVKEGLHKISITSGGDKAEGLLQVVKRSAQLVFVDVEGSLWEGNIAAGPRSGGVMATQKIKKKYPVIFLKTSIVGVRTVKWWLKEKGFPLAPVLPWNRGEALREMKEKNISIKAVVGGSEVAQFAKAYTHLAFSFDATGEEEALHDWDEVIAKIK